ncbi:MAG: DNA repair protein RecO [Pyrinomonadaceae bacterium]
MPLFESESLVLRSYDLSEADRIIVFFTREHGLIRGVAKGAKRLKSRFGSTLEPFSTVNLSYFQKEDRELVSIQGVELIRSRFGVASHPETLGTYAYLASLLMALLPPHDPNQTAYRMANACLDAEPEGPDELAVVRLYFELWLLHLGGYLPDWSRCCECRRPLLSAEAAALHSDLTLLCSSCGRTRRIPSVSVLERDLFQAARSVAPAAFVERAGRHVETVRDLSGILRTIVVNVVGHDLMNEPALAVKL